MEYFEYSDIEIEYLKSRDPVLKQVIEQIGIIKRAVIPDLFAALVNSIVGQQISTKAHQTIWQRINNSFSPITPANFKSLSAEELQKCGITMKKAHYIKEITRRIISDQLDLERLADLSNEEVIEQLCELPGIGRWTAEMILTFSLQRKDIISYSDLAILRECAWSIIIGELHLNYSLNINVAMDHMQQLPVCIYGQLLREQFQN